MLLQSIPSPAAGCNASPQTQPGTERVFLRLQLSFAEGPLQEVVLPSVARSSGKVGLLPTCILSLGTFLKDMSVDRVHDDLRAVAIGRLRKANKKLRHLQLCVLKERFARDRLKSGRSPHAASAGS